MLKFFSANMPSWMLTSGSRIVGGEDAPSPIPWQVSVFTGLAILNSKYLELEIKTFGLGSTIGDVFSEVRNNIVLGGIQVLRHHDFDLF